MRALAAAVCSLSLSAAASAGEISPSYEEVIRYNARMFVDLNFAPDACGYRLLQTRGAVLGLKDMYDQEEERAIFADEQASEQSRWAGGTPSERKAICESVLIEYGAKSKPAWLKK